MKKNGTFAAVTMFTNPSACHGVDINLYRMIRIKKTAKLLLAVFLLGMPCMMQAQLTKEQQKERKEIRKQSRNELNTKASKDARKQAKELKKAGWTVAPGALPIEKQLDKVFTMQYEYDEDLFPQYIVSEGMSVGGNYDAAKMQALELAKQNLAGQIQTEVTALIENTVSNKQLGADDAASVTQTISASKNLITQSLGRVLPVVEVYRTLPNKNKEVLVRIAYSANMAKAAVKKAVEKDLEDRGDELHKKLDNLLGW